ncbi:MAG: (2S)-methylsuccinyl-CoA dehydrogenase, partial [Celeribacter sp.]
MALDGQEMQMKPAILPDLMTLTTAVAPKMAALYDRARAALRAEFLVDGKISNAKIEANQTAAHGLAWLATYVEALRQMQVWAEKLTENGTFGEMEQLIHQIAFGEYISQIYGGIPMNQGEMTRLSDLGLGLVQPSHPEATKLMLEGNTVEARTRLVELMQDNAGHATFGKTGLDDDLEMIRDQFRRFSDERVAPFAHDWHLKDELIPMSIIDELAELGVFGLTIPEEFGGFGFPKAAMVVVSEELSRGYIGVGSLGTRSEIAAELILCGGTEEQKQTWLP